MSQQKQRRSFVSTSLRLFAALAFLGIMLVTNQTTTKAQECAPGCNIVDITNCMAPARGAEILFLLCCNGVLSTMPAILGPAPAPPMVCSRVGFAPGLGCTVVGVVNITSIPPWAPPPTGWNYNPALCTLYIW